MSAQGTDNYGLGEPQMLEKIDKLFACGVGPLINLPQIVVVGDQSSGKRSVLEGLIRKPLPRDSGLCTRFATQFIFRRAGQVNISVSIFPDSDAAEAHTTKTRAWKKADLKSLDSEAFVTIMQEVHEIMGLSKGDDYDGKKPTFSNDVLCLEIAGPDQEHLSVIDVPGIFKSTTDGLTTKMDIKLVRNMVLGYMKNPRSVMLVVIPANVDVATQEILEMAKEVDSEGDRTLGVLTKPDLVDRGAEPRVVSLINGTSHKLKLGWHLVRNPGQHDLSDPTLDRGSLEMNFFRSTSPWNDIPKDKVGVESLRSRLKETLAGLIKTEFPKVQQEIRKRLTDCQKRINALGPAREDSAAQMASLTEIATKFQRLVSLALAANYGADSIFDSRPSLSIASLTTARMKGFSDDVERYGQRYSFLPPNYILGDNVPPKYDDIDELVDILHPKQDLPHSFQDAILPWLQTMYKGNQGFELGTFNAAILPTAMKKLSSKWSDISMAYVSDVIVVIHTFIRDALESQPINHTEFLLEVEDAGIPMTSNHYFNENLQKSRQAKITAAMKGKVMDIFGCGEVIRLADATKSHPMSNEQHFVHEIHDILKSYYKVTRKTFVDNICEQATAHFLLVGRESPLCLFSPVFVSHLSTEEPENIAGELPGMRRERAQLHKEVERRLRRRRFLPGLEVWAGRARSF